MFDPKLQDRLKLWRDFRSKLESLPFESALTHCVEHWAIAPFVPYYLTADQVSSWPDPWTLIEENYYCDLAKALGILYTLYFTKHGAEHVWELRIYTDTETKYTYNTLYVDHGKYIINLLDNEIVDTRYLNESLVLSYQYSQVDLKLDQY